MAPPAAPSRWWTSDDFWRSLALDSSPSSDFTLQMSAAPRPQDLPVTLTELTASLPPCWAEPLQEGNRAQCLQSRKSLVVLDDDPTGTQTVSDIPVLTSWAVADLTAEFLQGTPVFYLLTNSRALTAEQTMTLHQEIGKNLRQVGEEVRREFQVISRSDSTLRGHFPLESDTLIDALQLIEPLTLFIPFFEAGGRITVDDVHYVVEGELATPAHLTPFAQDNAFPFSHSYLPDYLSEKSQGRLTADHTFAVSLDLLRQGGPEAVREALLAAPAGATGFVNATTLRDLEVLAAALHEVEKVRSILYRSAASFVQARAGLAPRELLTAEELCDPEGSSAGGLIVVGSHVPKTTAQLDHLLRENQLAHLELSVPALLDNPDDTLFPLSQAINQHLQEGQTVVLSTSRKRIDAASEEANLFLSQTISRALVALVQALMTRPRFLIAKGGITSSDLATQALGVRRAEVLGQILPGIPVWRLGPETRFPALPYIIFPGNVGGEDALHLALTKLHS